MVTLNKVMNYIAPLPVILVTTRLEKDGKNYDNIIPISWAGIIEHSPHMMNINISKGKYSGTVIKKTKEFGVCIPGSKYLEQVDMCGCTHGNKVDKFKLVNFTKYDALEINVPLISECTVNMECKLSNVIEFKSHEMFIGTIVKTYVDDEYVSEDGEPDYRKMDILCYVNGYYWTLGKKLEKLFYTSG